MEEILDPELEICDPHVHMLPGPQPFFSKRYMNEDLEAEVRSGHRVSQVVFIECMSGYRTEGPEAFRPVGETEFVVENDTAGLIGGIVGFAELRATEIDDVLAAHVDAGEGRFRGIRYVTTWDPTPGVGPNFRGSPPQLMMQDDFRRGFAALGRAGLSFDSWLYHHQLRDLVSLARAFPDVDIILDHLGGPLGVSPYREHRDEMLTIWRASLIELSRCPNVAIKLGGLGMPRIGMGWDQLAEGASSEQIAVAWTDAILWCIEQFGTERCMFESNFPVDKVSYSYVVVWNAFKKIVKAASESERRALFHDNAVRIYRLSSA